MLCICDRDDVLSRWQCLLARALPHVDLAHFLFDFVRGDGQNHVPVAVQLYHAAHHEGRRQSNSLCWTKLVKQVMMTTAASLYLSWGMVVVRVGTRLEQRESIRSAICEAHLSGGSILLETHSGLMVRVRSVGTSHCSSVVGFCECRVYQPV